MASNSNSEDRKLSEIFISALKSFDEIQNSDEPTNSKKMQIDVRNCIDKLEETTKLVNIGGIFSTNESFEEIATTNVKYLLLPGLLGFLTLKIQKEERILVLETAQIYFKDFLKRIEDYGIIENVKELKEKEENVVATKRCFDLNQMAVERNEKIKKYLEMKELEKELKELKKAMEISSADEEMERKYYLTFIKSLVNQITDELKSVKQEIPLAQHMARLKQDDNLAKNELKAALAEKAKMKPLKPIILTRNELQKKVFGAGYPSLPTMTVQEFYDQRVADGIFPAEGSSHQKSLQELEDPEKASREEEKEKIKKEEEIERDDEEYLTRTRNMDEFKDTHKRGYGNRMNRS